MNSTKNTPPEFLEFIANLSASAQENSEVLGLVLVGSTAETFRADEWSDHDFFLIVKQDRGEIFRNDLSWLPSSENIAFAARETDHGLKVVYTDGGVLEFAVFENKELELASVNTWTVPVDKANITERVEVIQARTQPRTFTLEQEWHLFLSTILIAVGRARRGELLIAGQGVRTRALNHVLGLMRLADSPRNNTDYLEDNLDRFRRVEIQYPEQARILNEISEFPVEVGARAFLDFVIRLEVFDEKQLSLANVVRTRFGWL